MRRVMCVWCPLWPVQRLRSEQPEPSSNVNLGHQKDDAQTKPPPAATPIQRRPVVLFAEGRRGFQVVVCSPEAALWGIRIGMPVGEVRSLLPPPTPAASRVRRRNKAKPLRLPLLKRADPAADRSRLLTLALHCHRYSPLVGLEEAPAPESLWLDISGSESLFGGEQKFAEQICADLARQGIQTRIAIADSWGAAWGVSHYGEANIVSIPAGQQANWLASLPIAALRISDTASDSLQTLDIATIDQLMRLPRKSLPSRFGKELVRQLDRALGLAPELLTPERPTEPLFAEWSFEEPISDRQTLDRVCEILLERLLVMLEERRAGLRELACHWLGTTTEPTSLCLLRPTTERRHLLGLLRLQNEQRTFTSSVHGVRMEVVEMGLSSIRQTTLFEDDSLDQHSRASAELIDRLSIRLGRRAVSRPRLMPDPQPEFACEPIPWLDAQTFTEPDKTINASRLRCRPLQLLQPPQPLIVREFSAAGLPHRVNGSVVLRIGGPERIDTGWWRGPETKRDYYRLELQNGATLWAFVDRETGHWFLHGLFV